MDWPGRRRWNFDGPEIRQRRLTETYTKKMWNSRDRAAQLGRCYGCNGTAPALSTPASRVDYINHCCCLINVHSHLSSSGDQLIRTLRRRGWNPWMPEPPCSVEDLGPVLDWMDAHTIRPTGGAHGLAGEEKMELRWT